MADRAATIDVLVAGAGAAGMAAAIFAAEAARGRGLSIVVADGARKPGAKILVSGGGRCNVTNAEVTADDFCGGPRNIVKNVLKAFGNARTLEWMADLGVALKLEPTGKYFPVSDSARTVLEALVGRMRELGAELRPSTRIVGIRPAEGGFECAVSEGEPLRARRLIVATGGLALPKSGSDGAGLRYLAKLGHAIVPTSPALVPLTLGRSGPLGDFANLSGLTLDMRLALAEPGRKPLAERTGSLLFTHFGISGPAVLDMSRHWIRRESSVVGRQSSVKASQTNDQPPTASDSAAVLCAGHPMLRTVEAADAWLREQAVQHPRRSAATAVGELYPERLAESIARGLGTLAQLKREDRMWLARALSGAALEVTGDRGYSFAETTAGGVDLREIDAATMESRIVPGMHLCGEVLDVDGRIGGFNFQWAWASGYLAGRGAVR